MPFLSVLAKLELFLILSHTRWLSGHSPEGTSGFFLSSASLGQPLASTNQSALSFQTRLTLTGYLERGSLFSLPVGRALLLAWYLAACPLVCLTLISWMTFLWSLSPSSLVFRVKEALGSQALPSMCGCLCLLQSLFSPKRFISLWWRFSPSPLSFSSLSRNRILFWLESFS